MIFSRVGMPSLAILSLVVLLGGCVAQGPDIDGAVPPESGPQLLGGECDQLLNPVAVGGVLGQGSSALPSLSLDATTLAATAAGGVRCSWSSETGLIDLWVLPVELSGTAPGAASCDAPAGVTRCALDVVRGGARVVGTLSDSSGRSAEALAADARTLERALPDAISPIDPLLPADGAGLPGCTDPSLVEAMAGSASSTQLAVRAESSAPAAVIDALDATSVSCRLPESRVTVTIVRDGAFLVPSLPPGEVVELAGAAAARTFTDPSLGAVTIAAAGADLVMTSAPVGDESQRVAESVVAIVARD